MKSSVYVTVTRSSDAGQCQYYTLVTLTRSRWSLSNGRLQQQRLSVAFCRSAKQRGCYDVFISVAGGSEQSIGLLHHGHR